METGKEKRRLSSKDIEFKRIVHNSDVLSWLIRCNVDEFKDKDISEIKSCLKLSDDGRFVIGSDTVIDSDDGEVRMDSIFDIRLPGTDEDITIIVNIEGQNDSSPRYPLGKRAEFYMSQLVTSQKGVKFTGDHYEKMCKVYSIWIMLDPKPRDRNTVVRYSMKAENIYGDDNRKMPVLDTFNIIFVCVGDYDGNLPDVSGFPAALFLKGSPEERRGLIEEKYLFSVDDALNRGLESLASIGEDTYNKIFREGKAEGIAEGKAEGKAEGIAEGKAEGKAEGIAESSINTAVYLISKEGWTLEKVLSVIDIPDGRRDYVIGEIEGRLN